MSLTLNALSQYLRLVLIFISLVLLLQVWQGYTSYQTFKEFHQHLSLKSVTSTAREIDLLIDSHRRAVSLFVEQKSEMLASILAKRNSQLDISKFSSDIEKYFPFHLTYLIADTDGKIRFFHEEALVGDSCKAEISSYADNDHFKNPVFIHPGKRDDTEHFDVLVPLSDQGKEVGIFFVSFRLKALHRILAHGEVVGHQLLLVKQDDLSHIELTTDQGQHANYDCKTLVNGNKIFHSADIGNSRWTLIDVTDDSLFEKEVKRLVVQGVFIVGIFSLISWLVLRILRNEDLNYGKARELLVAVESERRRIAMDMHDQVLSELSHIARKTKQLKQSETLANDVNMIQYSLEQVTNSIRSIVNDLHPHFLDNLGLEAAILSYLEKNCSGDHSPKWHLNIDESVDYVLSRAQRFNLYKIILEAINNIQKHADCSQFSINISIGDGILELVILDNGKGFYASRIRTGFGLNNIETRARLLNAQTSWDKPGKLAGSQFSLIMKIHQE